MNRKAFPLAMKRCIKESEKGGKKNRHKKGFYFHTSTAICKMFCTLRRAAIVIKKKMHLG